MTFVVSELSSTPRASTINRRLVRVYLLRVLFSLAVPVFPKGNKSQESRKSGSTIICENLWWLGFGRDGKPKSKLLGIKLKATRPVGSNLKLRLLRVPSHLFAIRLVRWHCICHLVVGSASPMYLNQG